MALSPILDLGELSTPLLVFGGPYSNLQATTALLDRARQLGIGADRMLCTGDVVAYGADPERTSSLIRDAGIHVVMGNCEESLAMDSDDCGCGFEQGMACAVLSDGWYRYARSRVSSATRDWMAGLPRVIRFTLRGQRCCVIHGGLGQINQFIFQSTEFQVKNQQLAAADTDVMIAGHCGIPFGQHLSNGAWLNAGVIGLPANDGTPDGWFMLLNVASNGISAEWQRLQYDYPSSRQAMLGAGLSGYADCIASGLWPSMDILPAPEKALRGQRLDVALARD